VLYRTEQLAFVQFRTADWEGYNGFSNYATTALFREPTEVMRGDAARKLRQICEGNR